MRKEKNIRIIIILLIIITSLLSITTLTMPTNFNYVNGLIYIADCLGYIGIVLLTWMYIIGTRSLVGLVIKDIAPMLKIHTFFAKYGTLLIFAHPILLTFGYKESWLYSFIIQTGNQFDSRVTLGRISLFILFIVWISSALLRSKIKYRPWKYIHFLSYIVLPFALLHIPGVGSNFEHNLSTRIFFFVTVVVLFIITMLRLRSFFNLNKTKYIIVKNSEVSKGVFMMKLKPKNMNYYIEPKNGQYIYLKLGFISEDHPFSVLQFNSQTKEIMLTYKQFGSFTLEALNRKIGQSVYLTGPFGYFTQEIEQHSQKNVVYIAGGVGVVPFVDRALRENNLRNQYLFYAVRDIPSATYISNLSKSLGPKLIPVVEDTNTQISGVETGYIDYQMIKKHISQVNNFVYYICGPEPMMLHVEKHLLYLGVNKKHIYKESFSF